MEQQEFIKPAYTEQPSPQKTTLVCLGAWLCRQEMRLLQGSETVFEAADSPYVSSVYDANAQKVVIVYNDSGDSSKGKGIVGTVSGTSISFGSPTSFHTGADDMHIAYDSVSQKVVIAFRIQINLFLVGL